MPENLQWNHKAWTDYLYWQQNDKATLRRVNQLINVLLRTPYDGIGKPELLRGNLSGFWSRRIDDVHRLVYMVEDDVVTIISCRGHYDK